MSTLITRLVWPAGSPGRECLQVSTTDANEWGELERLEDLEYQRMEAEVRTESCRWSGTALRNE